MRESLNEPVSVIFCYDSKKQKSYPYQLSWQNQEYRLGKVDFYHKTKHGFEIIHHYSVADKSGVCYFKLALNGTTLQWVLEEYMPASEMRVHYGAWEGA